MYTTKTVSIPIVVVYYGLYTVHKLILYWYNIIIGNVSSMITRSGACVAAKLAACTLLHGQLSKR